ncbi:hypothetical protein [Streptomyces sp. YS415]|uniref:hypothetical protein n=1 Tax=Streptomyces sp. YS415 TaxID=2944806 RepID=UPI002020A053|nr:hypothetical protein [Streptomyces sp. YS415]MCL7430152.1 hypothetical protein [Streptomyces sp. YS415]
MSAAAAAMLPERADDDVVGVPVIPAQRGTLQSVPACEQPGDGGLDDPLRLGRPMRLRLRDAVQALLADPSISGLKDAPKLAAVVLFAKSRARRGEKNDLQTSIWAAELGRWLGVGESTVHHKVLPPLRGSGTLRSRVVRDAKGHPTGLDCLLMPLWNAHHGGGVGHPLALSKAELATLLRLIEALFGPGWAPEGKEPTPPGLLASRTGKGAATDRLGLLLMVLNSRASGWLQLCGGSVKKREGRGAATLARLLGCSPSGARKVLVRLTEAGVVARQREATVTRMNGRGRVLLLPVARAYGRAVTPVESGQGAKAVPSQRPDGAVGDLAPVRVAEVLGTPGLRGGGVALEAVDQERPDGAELHTDHASVATPVSPLQPSCGFSGEGRGGEGHRPERVCVREDQAADGESAVVESVRPVAEDGPLRGGKPKESPVDERNGQRAAGVLAGGRLKAASWAKAQRQRRAGLPDDLGLWVALGPVSGLWERLSGWQQDQVAATAKAEMKRLAGILEQPEAAARLLADRLTDRLAETGGEALVDRPYPWLIRRGLVQRQACSDLRCDDGIRLDTGGECENCGNVLHLRRARRAKIAAQIDRELPGLADGERRRVLEERLREQAAIEAEDLMWRREKARAEQNRRDAACAAAQERAEREREAAAAADAVRQALPCEDCGRDQAAGLCEACSYRRQTSDLLQQAAWMEAAWTCVNPSRPQLEAASRQMLGRLREEADRAGQHLLAVLGSSYGEDPHAAQASAAYAVRDRARELADEAQRTALAALAQSVEAAAEAERAWQAEKARRPYDFYLTGPQADAPAAEAALQARHRTARHLLDSRLHLLQDTPAAEAKQVVKQGGWRDRLQRLAVRPLPDDIQASCG